MHIKHSPSAFSSLTDRPTDLLKYVAIDKLTESLQP